MQDVVYFGEARSQLIFQVTLIAADQGVERIHSVAILAECLFLRGDLEGAKSAYLAAVVDAAELSDDDVCRASLVWREAECQVPWANRAAAGRDWTK